MQTSRNVRVKGHSLAIQVGPGRAVASPWRIADLLVHAWDLVQATGVEAELPCDLAEQALAFVRAQLPSQPCAGRFADAQPIPDHAPAIDQLAAFTGRPVPWTHERLHQIG